MKAFVLTLLGLAFAVSSTDFSSYLFSEYERVQLLSNFTPNDAYLKALINGEVNDDEFTNFTWKSNNTLAVIGYLNGWHNDDKTKGDYLRQLNDRKKELSSGRLTPSYDEGKDLNSILSGVYSGLSYGFVFLPDKSQLRNYKKEYWTYYSFLVGQQQKREALLREHSERIALLKKELNFLYQKAKELCSQDWTPKWTPKPDELVNGTGTLKYEPIVYEIQSLRSRLKDLACLQVLTQIQTTKVQLELAELNLYDLSVSYNKLLNEERRLLESGR